MSAKHVFFDVNGTLFDPAALQDPLDPAHEDFAEDVLGDAVTLAMAVSLSGDYCDFRELLEAAARRRLKMIGEADRLREVMDGVDEIRPFREAAAGIQILREAGIDAGALSNSSTESVMSLIERCDLSLEPVIGTDQVGAFKPHPEVYRRAITTAGRRPEETVLVTAHSWDAIGGRAVGMRVAWVSRNEDVPLELRHGFDYVASDLTEAARMIAADRRQG